MDIDFLIVALDADYKLRKVERYLSLILESGAKPVIILNKADICGDYEDKVAEVKTTYPKVPVHAISAIDEWGLSAILSYLKTGVTVSLIGSSGVGKSTLINAIAGTDLLEVGEIRLADSRGRHTTAVREMVILSQGGVLIDNPGLRDIKIIGSEENLDDIFWDVVSLEKRCRFSDCRHDTEPGCAVKAAIENGILDAERLESYRTLKQELAHVNQRRYLRKKQEDIRIYKENRSRYPSPKH